MQQTNRQMDHEILIRKADGAAFDTKSTAVTNDDPGFEFSINGGDSWEGVFASAAMARDAAIWRIANPYAL